MGNERLTELDRAWTVYKEWLRSDERQVYSYSFADWLSEQYESARKECEESRNTEDRQ